MPLPDLKGYRPALLPCDRHGRLHGQRRKDTDLLHGGNLCAFPSRSHPCHAPSGGARHPAEVLAAPHPSEEDTPPQKERRGSSACTVPPLFGRHARLRLADRHWRRADVSGRFRKTIRQSRLSHRIQGTIPLRDRSRSEKARKNVAASCLPQERRTPPHRPRGQL